jgi:hypothetical protein
VAFVGTILCSYLSDRVRSRGPFVVVLMLLSAIGTLPPSSSCSAHSPISRSCSHGLPTRLEVTLRLPSAWAS